MILITVAKKQKPTKPNRFSVFLAQALCVILKEQITINRYAEN